MQLSTQEQCLQLFNQLKYRKSDLRYIIFRVQKAVEKGKEEKIKIEKTGARQKDWDSFMNDLPQLEYRYGIFDVQFVNQDKMNISKIVFIFWTPDNTPMKSKMVYATAKQNFKRHLGITKDYVICSKQDMPFSQLIKELAK